jgi:hypothetical protein
MGGADGRRRRWYHVGRPRRRSARRPRRRRVLRDADHLDEALLVQQAQRVVGLRDQLAHLVVAAPAVEHDQGAAQPWRQPVGPRFDL